MADANVTGGDGPAKKAPGGGILRAKPKYSSSQVVPSSASASATPAGAPAAGMSSIISSAYPIAEDDGAGNQFTEDQVPVVRPLIRDVVVERDPRRRLMQKQAATATDTAASPAAPSPGVAASAIEGYAPATGSGGSMADAGAAILSTHQIHRLLRPLELHLG